MKQRARSFGSSLKRGERRILIAWIRFAQRHRYSNILPIALFGVLFCDGFMMIIPSLLCLVAAVTISPHRWFLFSIIFALATAANNAATYALGRSLPPDQIYGFIEFSLTWTNGIFGFFGHELTLDEILNSARQAMQHYGSYATFIGALVGLPTQLITGLIGMADAQTLNQGLEFSSTFGKAITFSFLGHGTKSIILAGLTRYGWVRLEKKFQK